MKKCEKCDIYPEIIVKKGSYTVVCPKCHNSTKEYRTQQAALAAWEVLKPKKEKRNG